MAADEEDVDDYIEDGEAEPELPYELFTSVKRKYTGRHLGS
jgi:hypothetical protein